MKIERTKNAGRNILYGSILKIYQILVPFLMRTAMIYLMGAQYLGLNSLFTSVLQVLNLAELGVGSAMVYSMYKPIAEDDTDTICALMALYRRYYRIIGGVILIAGGVITPFIPQLIKMDTVPSDVNVYILYLLNLGATVITYWLFAYKNCLLSAFQREDVSSKISMVSSTITYILQFSVIYFWRNFYAYTVIVLLVGIVNNLITAVVVDRMYPNFHARGKLAIERIKDINHRVRDLFTSKIGSVVYDSADTIVISAFLGMSTLAVYQNYYFILASISNIVNMIFSACTAGIGNSLVVETKEKNYNDLEKFTFITCWIGGFCAACLLCLYQPFMELWVGKELMLDISVVICFVIYFYVRQINSLLNLYKNASGMWHEDRYRPLAAALANLVLNLILVQFIGIYGIILSTVLAILVVGEPWLLSNLFSCIFERKHMWQYLRGVLYYSVIVFMDCCVCYLLCAMIPIQSLIITLLVRGCICCLVPNILNVIIFQRRTEYKEAILLADRMTKGKLHRVLSLLVRS